MKKFFGYILTFLVIIVLIILVGLYYANNELNQNILIDQTTVVTLPKGTTLTGCVSILNQNGIFQPEWAYEIILEAYSRVFGKHIIAGSYKFKPGMTNKDVMSSIFGGKNLYVITVTYPEGITLKQFADITEEKFHISAEKFLARVNSPEILQKYGIKSKTAEGYLMPDTYQFYFDPHLDKILDKLFGTQNKIWKKKFAQQAKSMGWSRRKVLTLASIIEAETPIPDERPRISAVYHNRLNRGMLLQADPTVQYALGGKRHLSYEDLHFNSPYNTYIYSGLPPGPINSPGVSSIEAALNPEKNDYLYFVAKGDGSNRHNFATTMSQHEAFVAQYRRNLRKN